MARPELGTKRICAECEAKFYDLGNMPYICPMCQHVHEEKASTPPEEVEAKETPAQEPDASDDDMVTDAPEGVDVISLDEAEVDDSSDAELAALSDEELPEVPDDETSDDSDSDVFLEEDEDDPNVSDLIGGGITSPDDD